MLFCALLPGGDETTMVGLHQLNSYVLNWLPMLIWTVLVESTGSYRLSLISAALFHGMGAVIISMIDLQKAKSDIRTTMTMRKGAWEGTATTLDAGGRMNRTAITSLSQTGDDPDWKRALSMASSSMGGTSFIESAKGALNEEEANFFGFGKKKSFVNSTPAQVSPAPPPSEPGRPRTPPGS